MTRTVFDDMLTQLNRDVIELGDLVKSSINHSFAGLLENDEKALDKAVELDAQINDLENHIQSACIRLIAMQQPVARDLRMVTAILKMITDLERMGDYAEDIALIGKSGAKELGDKIPESLRTMMETAEDMVKDCVKSYLLSDEALARDVAERDNDVDACFEQSVGDIETLMKDSPEEVEKIASLILVSKYLERIGDHATNIAEWVLYQLTGKQEKLN
jgi:phosphate transport system protein